MRHTILSQDQNGTGTVARVVTEGWGLDLLRHALVDSWETELDLIAREGAERERAWFQTLPEEEARALGIEK